MESVLGRVMVMVAVGVVGGTLAIMLVRAEAQARHKSASSASKVVLESSTDLSTNLTHSIDNEEPPGHKESQLILKREIHEEGFQDHEEMQAQDGDIIDGILSVLRRKLLSYPLDVSEDKNDEDVSRHRVRHFGRKNHHRRYDETQPFPREVIPPVEEDAGARTGRQSNATTYADNTTHTSANSFRTANNSVSNTSDVDGVSVPRGEGDVPRSDKAGGQSTRPRLFDEVRDAVLLALPLSLLLTLLLVVCGACCCCRYRARLYHDQDPLTRHAEGEEEDEESREWTPLGLGLCDACLPDISYQVHLAKKTRPSRKRRPDLPLGLALEHPDVASGTQGLKCHPPLYKLLSNLPPGENVLQDEPVVPMLRRSQSLEHLSV
ncbi:uncharacterized protein LOC122263315 [Penaeus japonicus]|uniref:uncharacterized protein LOC122263315 n=1 Tax=Penaeus japonicus TaxID=27405 RepID=UPI001C70E7CF|nr:uncharacterized protein LOC122263315 [Penaeus japonicus]